MLNRKALAKALTRLSSIYSDTAFIGISSTKSHLMFYIHDSGLLSLLRIPYKNDISDCLVFVGALRTAVEQMTGETINIDMSDDGQFLNVGHAQLALRDAIDIQDLLKQFNTNTGGENLLPEKVCKLIATQFHTYVSTKPRSVFGWSLQIKKRVAYYGSASQPMAKYGYAEIDTPDLELRIPDDTCQRVYRIIPYAEAIYFGEKVMRIDHDGISHYVMVENDHPSINLNTAMGLLQNEVTSLEAVKLEDPITNILKFSDPDSTVLLTIENGKMVADVTGRMGKNRVEIATFDKKVRYDARIKPTQLSNMLIKNPVYVSLAVKDKTPIVLVFTEKGTLVPPSQRKKTEDDEELGFKVFETVYMGALT